MWFLIWIFFISISWIRFLYIYRESEILMTICNIINEVWMNLLHAYTFTRVSNDDCSWSNNPCIMTVDKWSIEIYIVQKTIPLWLESIWKWSWSTYLKYGPHTKLMRKVNYSWVDTTFVKVYWYSPCKKKKNLH